MIKTTSKKIKQPKKLIVKKITTKTTRRTIKKQDNTSWLTKAEHNPIISPKSDNNWESWQTFNPGVILLDNKVHFIYRAIGHDGVSRLGYAVSNDGFVIDERLSAPAYEHKIIKQVQGYDKARATQTPFEQESLYPSGGSWGGAEDPRLVRIGKENVLYMTYTACDDGLRVGLTSIKINDFLNKKWRWQPPILISPHGKVNKNWMIFPEKINNKYAILHNIKPTIQIEYVDNLEFSENNCIDSLHGGEQRNGCWDKWLRGAGAPPLKTDKGWLLFYHAMDNDWSKYKVGAMLLDLNDPTKILYRAKKPVMAPKESYENNGYKPGIVYVSGAVIKDGNLLVYYGCSDSYVGVAYAHLKTFLDALEQDIEPKLKFKPLISMGLKQK